MEGEGTHRTLIALPENALIQEVVETVGYIDPEDSKYKYAVRYSFERMNSALGLMFRAAHDIMHEEPD